MFTRRQFLTRTLHGSSLVALGAVVPQFVARTAQAAAPGKDNILVVLEMTGGNDGLNTVIPYADDLYHKARPTLRQTKDAGHPPGRPRRPALRHARAAGRCGTQGQLAVVQGVGYPNPDRSHFEAMDIWQSADPKRATTTGWLGRGGGRDGRPLGRRARSCTSARAACRWPWPARRAAGRSASTTRTRSASNSAGGEAGQQKARRQLLEELSTPAGRRRATTCCRSCSGGRCRR